MPYAAATRAHRGHGSTTLECETLGFQRLRYGMESASVNSMKMLSGGLLLLVGSYASAADSTQTFVKIYPKSTQATAAEQATDAASLFEDAQARLIAGKYGTARLAFQTLVTVYPESPLVKSATAGIRVAEQLEETHGPPKLRSLRFEYTRPVKVEEILQRFEEREVALSVEQPYESKAAEEAKSVLTELLIERGVRNPRVEVKTRNVAPRKIDVTFLVKKD
jgi:hypothetical protein